MESGRSELLPRCSPCNDEFRKLFGEQTALFCTVSWGSVSRLGKEKSMGDPRQSLHPKLPVQHRSLASAVEQCLAPQVCVFLPADSFTTPKFTYINLLKKPAGVC